jgi:predicted ATP-binding protein involved in virulence
MRIERLEVKNFRCLEDITINFPNNNMAVIVGINGSGKSAILDSLKIFLTRIIDGFLSTPMWEDLIGYVSPLIEQNDIHYASKNFKATVIMSDENDYHFEGVCEARVLEKGSFKADEMKFENFDSIVKKYSLYVGDSEPKNIPIFVYYNGVSKEREQLSDIPVFPQQVNAYRNCMSVYLKSYLEFTQWFEGEESYENERRLREEPSFRIPTLEVVRFAMETFLEQLTNISFSDLRIVRHSKDSHFVFNRSTPNPPLVIKKGNQDFKIEQLSSGEKSLLMLVTDMAKRLAIANPGLGVNAWQGEGIVLIDEIDLHLHPQWQRRVLPALTKTFPNCQFIVTTHSPQVLSEVPKESVFILENGKLLEYSPHTRGRDSNSILYEIFNVKERPEWSQKEIDHCLDLIDNEKWDEAREALKELSNLFGNNDTAVVQAQTIFHFMED